MADKPEEKKPFGRPTKYTPDMCDESGGCVVYGMFDRDGRLFYIGSTNSLKRRVSTYSSGSFHGNVFLKRKCGKGFSVKVLYTGDDFRDVEVCLIKKYNPKCNFFYSKFFNRRYGYFHSYYTRYQNMFGKTDFLDNIKNFFDSLCEEEKAIVNERFVFACRHH